MRINWFLVIAIIIMWSFCSSEIIYGCDLSDTEAINLTIKFCNTMSISCPERPWVLRTDHDSKVSDLEFKDVRFGVRGDYKITMHVSCNNREVDFYNNSELKQKVREKYRIPSVNTDSHGWPSFISENKAREKIFIIAKKIGLPNSVEFSQLGLDKENGYWGGSWVRRYNGYQYEKDFVNILITAVDGEFILYGKRFLGKPCPTEVKVKKEEAIEEGWHQIVKLFTESVDWNKHKKDYEIKSADLKIIQPNTLAGNIVPRFSAESRLAWVVVYGLKIKPDRYKLAEIDYLQRITIKIDAATKKFLGGDYTQ